MLLKRVLFLQRKREVITLKRNEMRVILPHTDLTNPELYDRVVNLRDQIILVERPYDRQMCGTIHTTAIGWNVFFTEKGKYWIEDQYGNDLYLGVWNNRWKVFDFYRQNEVQLCDDFDEMRLLIKRFFKRS